MEDRIIANSVLAIDSFFEGEPCWEWIGQRNSRGYPYMSVRRPGVAHPCKVLAHRVSIETFHGPIPEGYVAMHRCNNPICVSPLHLRAGTQSDNVNQCVAEGRHNSQAPEAWHREY